MSEPCRHLPWDTAFFGRRIARLDARRPSALELDQALAWCMAEGVECLYFLAEDDPATAALAEERGFRLTDLRVTLRATGAPPGDGCDLQDIRLCRPEDIDDLRAIARGSYSDSRFYADPGFPRERCDALYDTWLLQSCAGHAAAVLVAGQGARAVGYVTCLRDGARGEIGLLGVAAAARGGGLGLRLVRAARHWFWQDGAAEVHVVTQGRNAAAQRIYQRAGFVTERIELWFHRWFASPAQRAA